MVEQDPRGTRVTQLQSGGVGIAVRQEDKDLREKLNKALDEIRKDGSYKKINDKYLPIDVYTMK